MPSALVLQTQDNCPPGLLCDWAEARSVSLDVLRVDRWEHVPSPSEYAFGVLLGSSASLVARPPGWVARELEWVVDADAAGLPLLGICFGAQALATALGGSAVRLPMPERAWIELTHRDPALIPAGPWVATHEDGIRLPAAASERARNAFGVQAFTAGPHLGVQFHPEVTPADLPRWVADKDPDVRAGLLTGSAERFAVAAAAAFVLFDAFLRWAGLAPAAAAPVGVV